MCSCIIMQLLGRMGVDFSEDGNFFCKVTCKQHGKTLGDLSEGFQRLKWDQTRHFFLERVPI